MKHTEIPTQMTKEKLGENPLLEPGDKMVYAAIRRYMNADNRECFPSYTTICGTLKTGRTKVANAIDRLVAAGFLQKNQSGTGKYVKNSYYFPITEFDKKFEKFTDEFLDLDLPLNVKEYYMDIQQFLYGKETGTGRCSLSNAELARRTGWSIASIKRYNTVLIEKGYLEEDVLDDQRDQAGLPIIQKSFNLTGLHQAALWVKAVTKQVAQNTDDIEAIKAENAEMRRRLAKLEAAEAARNKREALDRNKVVDCAFPM